jgi:hypothetical protein
MPCPRLSRRESRHVRLHGERAFFGDSGPLAANSSKRKRPLPRHRVGKLRRRRRVFWRCSAWGLQARLSWLAILGRRDNFRRALRYACDVFSMLRRWKGHAGGIGRCRAMCRGTMACSRVDGDSAQLTEPKVVRKVHGARRPMPGISVPRKVTIGTKLQVQMGAYNSSLCRITWTDAVNGSEHFVFAVEQPLELRLGLRFEPGFWSSFDFSLYNLVLRVFRGGIVVATHQQSGGRLELPGGQSAEQWLGVSFGQATQVIRGSIPDIYFFRPAVIFWGGSPTQNIAGQFAMAPDEHCFLIDGFAPFDGISFPSEQLVGGVGRP